MQAEDKDLLKKFLYGYCTPEENLKVQELLKQPGIQEVMQELTLQEWNEPASSDGTANTVISSWKEKLNNRILMGELETEEKQVNRRVRRLSFLRYAAVWTGLLLMSGVAVWQFKKTDHSNNIALVQKNNMQGQPVKYLLPDSSEVYLGAGSRLSYPVQFAGNKREINLQGEAFFQVKHNASKPFIIHTGEIQTQVLGTSFKVKAFDGQPLVVAVATGKVGVSSHNGEQSKTLALLTPGLKITWNSKTQKAVQGTVDIYSLEQWKSGDMVFEDQPMEQIAAELQRRYTIKIDFMDRVVANNQVSGTFPSNKPVDKVMNTLAMAGKFRFETKDNKSFKIYKTE